MFIYILLRHDPTGTKVPVRTRNSEKHDRKAIKKGLLLPTIYTDKVTKLMFTDKNYRPEKGVIQQQDRRRRVRLIACTQDESVFR